MKKILSLLLVGTALVVFSGCTTNTDSSMNAVETLEQALVVPDRPAELNGMVRSIEGNEIVLANELRDQNLTEEEKAAEQEKRKSMTQEERQALKAAEMESVETETVTFTVPVGVPVLKGSGLADGTSVNADIAEIQTGSYISVWMNNDEVEVVKLKGVN